MQGRFARYREVAARERLTYMICFWNGEWNEERDVRVPLLDRGYLQGDGLFETIAVREGAPEFLDEHLERLSEAAGELQLGWPVERADLRDALAEMPRRAGVANGRMRLMLTRGTYSEEADDDAAPHGWDDPRWRPNLSVLIRASSGEIDRRPRSLSTAKVRVASGAMTAGHKCLSYVDKLAARRDAQSAGAWDALLLNERGELVECTMSNIAWISEGRLETPADECGCLPGVMRRALLEAADRIGLECIAGAYFVESLARAEAIFVTNSLIRRIDIDALDGKEIGGGAKEFCGRLDKAIDAVARESREALT